MYFLLSFSFGWIQYLPAIHNCPGWLGIKKYKKTQVTYLLVLPLCQCLQKNKLFPDHYLSIYFAIPNSYVE